MHNLRFNLFDDAAIASSERILMFYSFDTEDRLPRSGILHYNVQEQRFMGPRRDLELTRAALEFLSQSGRLASQQ